MNYTTFLIFFISVLQITCNDLVKNDSKILENNGKVIAIIDGDTFDILLTGNKKKRIRMDAIDAPEKGMPFYKASKKHLSELCFQKEVYLVYLNSDQHGRSISRSYLSNGTDLSKEMIKSGMAWHYKEYSSDNELSKLELQAKEKKIGLWADRNPMEPWVCRKLRRKGNHIEFSNDTIIVRPTK